MILKKAISAYANTYRLPLFILLCAILLVGVPTVGNWIQIKNEERLIDENLPELASSEAGRFAIRYFYSCMPSRFSGTGNLVCAKEVTDGARALYGDAFAREVATAIKQIIEVRK